MSFAFPSILWALLAVGIPVIVHLFDFRKYRKVNFSDNYLLLQLLEKNRRQSKIRQLIIMSLRMLLIAALVTAFARPYIGGSHDAAGQGGMTYVSLYIDNSLSMQMSQGKYDLLSNARKKAVSIVRAYPPTTLFRIITNDFAGMHERFVTSGECIEQIQQTDISPFSRKMSQVIARMSDLAEREAPDAAHHFFVISDFQKATSDIMNCNPGEHQLFFAPEPAGAVTNIGVDSVWFSGPLQLENNLLEINARIKNYSNVILEKIPVRLYVDGRQKGLSDVQLAAGGSDVVSFSFTVTGRSNHSGYIEVDDSPLTFDDRHYFAFDISKAIPVYHMTTDRSSGHISRLFEGDSLFDYFRSGNGNAGLDRLSSAGLIILDELPQISGGIIPELLLAVEQGANILIIPPVDMDAAVYRRSFEALGIAPLGTVDTANTKVSWIDSENPLFQGVFETMPSNIEFPVVYSSYRLPRNAGRSLFAMLNGQSFLTDFPKGRGHIFLLSSPLQPTWTSFGSHALIVPTVLQMAFSGVSVPVIAYSLDHPYGIAIRARKGGGEKPPVLRSFDGSGEMIPGYNSGNPPAVYLNGQVTRPGAYQVMDGNQVLMSFGLNYSATESDPKSWTGEEIETMLKGRSHVSLMKPQESVAALVADIQQGTKLWKIFIIFALLFYAAELILLRIWR